MIIYPPVTSMISFLPTNFSQHYRSKFKNPVKKGLFFLYNEGPLMTLRKYNSKIIEKKIEKEIVIIVALIEIDSNAYVGFTRYLGPQLQFNSKLLFALDIKNTLEDITLCERSLSLLESFLPVQSCPVPDELEKLLLNANKGLKKLKSVKFTQNYSSNKNHIIPLKTQLKNKQPSINDGEKLSVFFIGFGSYIREYVMHHFKGNIVAAVDYKADLINKYVNTDFPVVSQFDDMIAPLSQAYKPLVIISTYHSDHAQMALDVIDINTTAKVFIEKPPAISQVDADRLIVCRNKGAWIDVGFNRRYAKPIQEMDKYISKFSSPITIVVSVKELKLHDAHWYFWPNQGTRITGNVCHWIDLITHFIRSSPVEITVLNVGDNVTIGLLFLDGSFANIVATDRGCDLQGVEEYIEVRSEDTTLTLCDFKNLTIRKGSQKKTIKTILRDKGHLAMYAKVKESWMKDLKPLYPVKDIYQITYLTETISKMVTNNIRAFKINDLG
jgi:predicted dehydrogenase